MSASGNDPVITSYAQAPARTGIGHMPQLEYPDDFATRVLEFLADVERATATA